MPRILGPPEPALCLQVFVLDLEMCVADPTHVMHFLPQIQVIATPKSHISINVVTGKT